MVSGTTQPVHYEDIVGVRTRVSWGALLGGTVIAIATSLILTFFFAAVGFSLTEADVQGNAIGIAAAIAAIGTVVVSLFIGGWVTTQLTAGETHREAVIYGVLTWATVTAFSLGMVGMNIKAGYFALVGGSLVTPNAAVSQQRSWEDLARSAGISQERIDAAKQGLNPDRIRAEASDPANQRRAEQTAVAVSWGALAALLLSILSAVGGALVGAGPSYRLFRTTGVGTRREVIVTR